MRTLQKSIENNKKSVMIRVLSPLPTAKYKIENSASLYKLEDIWEWKDDVLDKLRLYQIEVKNPLFYDDLSMIIAHI